MRDVTIALFASSFLLSALAHAAPPVPINFGPATCALSEFTEAQGWQGRHLRFFADVNGDKRQDIVGFKDDGVYVSLSIPPPPVPVPVPFPLFSSPTRWIADFGSVSGWDVTLHELLLADVDGNGRADIVGFGNKGVFVAHSDGRKFRTPRLWLADFGAEQGWRKMGIVHFEGEDGPEIQSERGPHHVRMTADVNGDGRADIVGFGNRGVFYALSTGLSFTPTRLASTRFGYEEGWRVYASGGALSGHIRTMADVTGDRRADIVAMGDHGVYVAVSLEADGFTPAYKTLAPFDGDHGYGASQFRALGDIDGDGRADIMGIAHDSAKVFYGSNSGDFGWSNNPNHLFAGFGTNTGWASPVSHPRMLTDLNGDGTADFVGFGDDGVWTALTIPGRDTWYIYPVFSVAAFGSKDPNWRKPSTRFTPDINGDGRADLAGFGTDCVWTALSQ